MGRAEEKQKLQKLPELLGRYKYALLAAALGVGLLMWPEEGKPSPQALPSEQTQELTAAEELSEEMEEILGKIRGVGRVDVMLTVQSGPELVLAQDQSLSYSGLTQAPDSYDRSGQTVVLSGSGGEEDVVVTQERQPQYRGALVVCQGGDSDAVRLQVVEAVAALTGLGADRIAVMKWEGEQSVKGTVE